MMWRVQRVLLTILIGLLLVACGGSKKKKTAKPKKSASGEISDSGEEVQKTGDEGFADEGSHRMAANARGIYNDGVRAAASGSLAEAEKAFKRVLDIDSKAHLASYNLGVISERRGDETQAKSFYMQALNVVPDHLPSIKALSKIDLRKGNHGAALNLLESKAQEFPKKLGILNHYADVLITAGEYHDAIAQAKKVLKSDERNAEAMLRIGKANLRLGRYELAESVFEQVLKINPDNAEIYFLRSEIRLNDQQKAAAIMDLQQAIEKNPQYVEAMNNLSTIYLLSGNYESAVDLLGIAVKLSPGWGRLQLNYGNALRGAQRWKEAKDVLNKALALDSALIGAIFNLGLLYYTAGDFEGMDRIKRLNESKRLFAKYKSEMGSKLTKNDPVHKYLKEVQVALEREETRIARAAEREKMEAERAKQREAQKAKEAEDGDATSTDATEGSAGEDEAGEEDGWF